MVIYRTADGQPGYHQAEELDEAVRFVERLRNGDGVDGARIFKMEEVNFDFRPYFKVEIGPGGVPMETQVNPAFAGRDHGFSADLGAAFEPPAPPAGYEAPAPAAGYEAPAPAAGYEPPAFEAQAWSEPESVDLPVESAVDLGLEPEPVPSFVAPPSVTDPSVIDALPAPTAEGDEADAGPDGARRGLFGR